MSAPVMYDTLAALTSSYLEHHLLILKVYPNIVYIFEAFDVDKPFEPIKLMGSINNISDFDPENHGMLSAVIRYYTPYQTDECKQLLLAMSLRDSLLVTQF